MTTDTAALANYFLLLKDVAYLNHGSFGACPKPVFETYQRFQRELENQPMEFLDRTFNQRMREARYHLANYVGVQYDEIIFVPNTTTGLNIIARSLEWSPGDELVTTDMEYGATIRMWESICKRHKVRMIQEELTLPIQSSEQIFNQLRANFSSKTKVLFISHINSGIAVLMPLKKLIASARNAGILTIVDGAHGPGQLDLALNGLGVDFYVGNCHKWMMAPKGSAILFARKEVQHLITPLIISLGTSRNLRDLPKSPFIVEQEYQGTRDISSYLTVPAAIKFAKDHNWTQVRADCSKLLHIATQKIGTLTGLAPIVPPSLVPPQMCSLPLPKGCHPSLQKDLYSQFSVEVPVITHKGAPFLRISIQGYNTHNDIMRLETGLRALIK